MLIIACDDDDDDTPVDSGGLEFLPSLLGEYEGTYEYTTDYGLSGEHTSEYAILWRFSDQNYWMFDNTDSADSVNGVCICEPSGTYVLAEGVEIEMEVESCGSCVFDTERLPNGAFTLRQPSDSVIMSQTDSENNICKTIRLVLLGG